MRKNGSSESQSSAMEPTSASSGSSVFWRVFWLGFLVLSLGYAGYFFYAPGNRIAWSESHVVAQRLSAETDKPIMLFFTGKWCSPCQIMKRQVFADDEVAESINAGLIPVTIDVDDADVAATLSRYRIGGTPRTIITDAGGDVVADWQGRMSKVEFVDMLGAFGLADSAKADP